MRDLEETATSSRSLMNNVLDSEDDFLVFFSFKETRKENKIYGRSFVSKMGLPSTTYVSSSGYLADGALLEGLRMRTRAAAAAASSMGQQPPPPPPPPHPKPCGLETELK